MMSVFCSSGLIFALEIESRKCILRCPDFKLFTETRAFVASFFPSQPTPKLLPPN